MHFGQKTLLPPPFLSAGLQRKAKQKTQFVQTKIYLFIYQSFCGLLPQLNACCRKLSSPGWCKKVHCWSQGPLLRYWSRQRWKRQRTRESSQQVVPALVALVAPGDVFVVLELLQQQRVGDGMVCLAVLLGVTKDLDGFLGRLVLYPATTQYLTVESLLFYLTHAHVEYVLMKGSLGRAADDVFKLSVNVRVVHLDEDVLELAVLVYLHFGNVAQLGVLVGRRRGGLGGSGRHADGGGFVAEMLPLLVVSSGYCCSYKRVNAVDVV